MAVLEQLVEAKFNLDFACHARSILELEFEEPARELERVLLSLRVDVDELLEVGGGVSRPTLRLRSALEDAGWHKHNFKIEKRVDGKARETTTHEIDHVRRDAGHSLALEIEWNTKDTFFDRDLENFKRLHIESAISIGLIITRGESFHSALKPLILERCLQLGATDWDRVQALGIERTKRQHRMVDERIASGLTFADAFARVFVEDKFGEATTHWAKLHEKMQRGAGGSCPLVLIGIPRDVIVTH